MVETMVNRDVTLIKEVIDLDFSDFNPFGQRAFTKDFEYLTPFNSPTFSGTNTPFTGPNACRQ